MHPTDALHPRLWEVGDVRCILLRHDSATEPFEVVVFKADRLVKSGMFVNDDAAADFAIAQMRAAYQVVEGV